MNAQRNLKAMTFVTLALFLSGADARATGSSSGVSLQNLRNRVPGFNADGTSHGYHAGTVSGHPVATGYIAGSNATGTNFAGIAGKVIRNDDPLVTDENEYIDLIEFVQKALKRLDADEIQELIKECPELEVLNRPGPFDREMIVGMVDSAGKDIDEKEIYELMARNKLMTEKFSGSAAARGSRGSAAGTGSASGTGHHRNLEVSMFDVEKEENHNDHPVVKVLKKIDPLIWRISTSYKEMNNYDVAYNSIKDAEEALVSDFTVNTLNEAEDLKAKGSKSLYTSYRWLKTSASVLHRLLKRVEFQVIARDRKENQLEKYYDDLYALNNLRDEMTIDLTPEQEEAQELEVEKREAELDALYQEIWETEEEAQEALDAFGKGVEKSQKYLDEADNYSVASRNKVTLVQNEITKKRDEAKANVDGKSDEYDTFAKEQRALAYGTCAGVCVSPLGIFTGGAACVTCYGIAAGVLESKLADFRDKNEELRKKYNSMSGQVDVVLDRVLEIITGLNGLDDDIVNVQELIDNAFKKYEDVKDTHIAFLTEDAGVEDGTFTEFMEMLEHTIDYEKELRKCGKPDCKATCMQEPIFNEGNNYTGCWNQTYRGNKCRNWLEAGQAIDAKLGIGNHNYCRDPDNKGQAWCYLDDPLDGKVENGWEYCVDPTANPLAL